MIAGLERRGERVLAEQLARWQPTTPLDLLEARRDGRLHDPVGEGFVSRRRLVRRAGDIEYESSVFLYSSHQLILLSVLKRMLPRIRFRGETPYIDVDPFRKGWWDAEATWLAGMILALSALEPLYLPSVVQRIGLPGREELHAYLRWRRKVPLTSTLKWLGVEAAWLREAGAHLLHRADDIDPLAEWLVREADPSCWLKLKGDARIAVDMRIAAELLLGYYEELAKGRRATPLPRTTGRWRGEFDSRLKREGHVDRVLTDFGLSPHPSLVLVVEGDTEHLLIPRLMAYFGIRTDEAFIRIINAESVNTNLQALVAYAIAPSL